jgi:predicted TPR repeat methyltransferase
MRRATAVCLVLAPAALLLSLEARAQMGAVKGHVKGADGEPVEKVQVTIEFLGGVTRKLNTSTNAKGDFVQIGLTSGSYRLTFQKQGYEPLSTEVRVRMGDPTEVGDVVLQKIPEGGLSREQAAQLGAEVKKAFEVGVAASQKGDHPAALAAFQKVLELMPDSADGYYNIGFTQEKLGNSDAALAAYSKAVELRPDYYEALVALSNVHNLRKDYQAAMEALSKALELRPAEPTSLYNLGAIAMNAGDIPAAQQAFEKLIAVNPEHAAAHFQLGMVFVNQAKNDEAVQHLEKYLALEPSGQHATTAQGVLQYLKK